MPKYEKKLRPDVNETAFKTVQEAIGRLRSRSHHQRERTEADKSATAKERGSKGGKKGGDRRADSLTSDQRREIAKIAASARWKETPQSKGENDSGEAR